jgi:hypothetical protein
MRRKTPGGDGLTGREDHTEQEHQARRHRDGLDDGVDETERCARVP